jgi:hypothetical protein
MLCTDDFGFGFSGDRWFAEFDAPCFAVPHAPLARAVNERAVEELGLAEPVAARN